MSKIMKPQLFGAPDVIVPPPALAALAATPEDTAAPEAKEKLRMPTTDEKDSEWTAEELNPSVDDIRRIVEEQRAECGDRHSFRIVDRALARLDGKPGSASILIADRIFIESLTPDEVRESPWVVAALKIIYRAIDRERGACPND